MEGIKIGQLAQMCGCQVGTIHYYEREGLLPPPPRSEGNYRLYQQGEIERLRFILHCRRHGMNLREIKELLSFKDHPTVQCDWINSLLERHIKTLGEQIASLQALQESLRELAHTGAGGKHAECGILTSLQGSDGCPHCHACSAPNGSPKPRRA